MSATEQFLANYIESGAVTLPPPKEDVARIQAINDHFKAETLSAILTKQKLSRLRFFG